MSDTLRIIPLGGLGEVGKNMTVYELGDEQSDMALPPLDALAEEHDAVAIHAERVDGNTYAVDVLPH